MADAASVKAALLAAFRPWVVDGVPGSGDWEPVKTEIRVSLGGLVDYVSQIERSASGGQIGFATKAAMDGNLAYPAGTIAQVLSDSTSANNQVYLKTGASGAGAWAAQGAGVFGGKADKATTITTQGLAQGGGSLSADRVINVIAASEASIRNGVSNSVALTPLGFAPILAEINGVDAAEYLDTGLPIFRDTVGTNGVVLMREYLDGRIDFRPGPFLEEFFGDVGAGSDDAAANLDPDTVLRTKVIDAGLTRVWSDQDGSPRRYDMATGVGSLSTALMVGASVTAILGYGQSNQQGNSNGVAINTTSIFPSRALMLSSGLRGSGNVNSNAGSIPDFLPAVEAVNGLLGETPVTQMMNALCAADGYDERKVYVGRVPAMGGFTVLQLAPGSIPYTNMIAEAGRMVQLLAASEPERIDIVLTQIEGETDAVGDPPGFGNGTPYAAFVTRQKAILNSAIADIEAIAGVDSALWIINQAGVNSSFSGVRYANLPAAAQYDIVQADTSGKIFMGEPHWQFPVFDNFHSTAESKAILGELNARTLRLIRAGKPHAVSLASCAIVGTKIELVFDLPDGVNLSLLAIASLLQYGFRLRTVPFDAADHTAGADIPISSVTLAAVSGRTRKVIITPSSPPVPGQELRYAFHDNNSVGGSFYTSRGGLGTTTTDRALLDNRLLPFMAPCFRVTL